MPKEISHIYFSEEIQKGLRAEIQTILEKHKNLYYYGSSSPDLFYYYLPLKKKRISRIRFIGHRKIHTRRQRKHESYL